MDPVQARVVEIVNFLNLSDSFNAIKSFLDRCFGEDDAPVARQGNARALGVHGLMAVNQQALAEQPVPGPAYQSALRR